MVMKKVVHATVRYDRGDGANIRVMRGDVHDFPDDVAERLEAAGALTDVDQVLPVQGTVFDEDGAVEITSTSTDEEILAWLQSVTWVELAQTVQDARVDDPELSERLSELSTRVVDVRTGNPIFDPSIFADPDTEGDDDLEPELDEDGNPIEVGGDDEQVLDDLDVEAGGEDPALVVTHSVAMIGKYLKAHPDEAPAVLAAENARADALGTDARSTLIRLAQSVMDAGD